MQPFLRPVGIGLILGLLSLLFGVVWAVNLTVNHDSIHKRLNDSAMSVIENKFVINSTGANDHSSHDGSAQDHDAAHDHSAHDHGSPASMEHTHDGAPSGGPIDASAQRAVNHHGHDTPWMEAAHERLTRGHLHAMGLGLLAICVSLTLSLIKAPVKIKTLASACVGIGGFFYPFSWIIMGFRTPALGMDGAAESVFPIAAFSVFLVVTGILLTLFYVIKGFLSKD
ncbi:MAG: hypothetical protein HY889_00345 [Deltaproteobacteria bacterium]|nr:hypothetical protein [Deltaproteobacteria bacterium]